MKLASTVPVPYLYFPGATATTTRRRRTHRLAKVRHTQTSLPEDGDELARKQEVVCASLLGLSLFSTLVLCLWQLATA